MEVNLDPYHLSPGSKLGSYLIGETLGSGVAATVYRAQDVTRQCIVALKVLHTPHKDGGMPLARMRREIELLSRLDHRGICHVFELGVADSLVFLVMEYIIGKGLSAIIEREGKITPARVMRIFHAIAKALATAHVQDIIHRDLKPSNIMLRDDDTPVILDFGLAKGPRVSQLTSVGVWVGTFQYAAPEILRGERPSKASDVFALGVSLYQSLTGELPFRSEHVGPIAEAMIRHGPTPASELVTGVLPTFDDLIAHSLRFKANERPKDASEFAAELERILPKQQQYSKRERDEITAIVEMPRRRRYQSDNSPKQQNSEQTPQFSRDLTPVFERPINAVDDMEDEPTAMFRRPQNTADSDATSIFKMPLTSAPTKRTKANSKAKASVKSPAVAQPTSKSEPTAASAIEEKPTKPTVSSQAKSLPTNPTQEITDVSSPPQIPESLELIPEPLPQQPLIPGIPWRYVSPNKGGLIEPKSINQTNRSASGPQAAVQSKPKLKPK
ncbi:MAG: protein kinase [Deltaproteobacteria bacterium]|nr:protein kinase [Deltaproteobacteria bacterium]